MRNKNTSVFTSKVLLFQDFISLFPSVIFLKVASMIYNDEM